MNCFLIVDFKGTLNVVILQNCIEWELLNIYPLSPTTIISTTAKSKASNASLLEIS